MQRDVSTASCLGAALASMLFAWPASVGAPAPASPPPTSVLLIAMGGRASPVACVRGGRFEPGTKCGGPLRSRQPLRSSSGSALSTVTWNATGGLCPWSLGETDDAKLHAGDFSLCPEGASCFDDTSPPKLALWPPSSRVRLAPAQPLKVVDPKSAPDIAVLAARVNLDPKSVVLDQVFEFDLDGDGRMDRVVQLRQPRAKPHPADVDDAIWTFILIGDTPPVALARAGCSNGGQLLGTVDLDGDRKMELVMLFQYQVVLFRLDGSVLVENAECCGYG